MNVSVGGGKPTIHLSSGFACESFERIRYTIGHSNPEEHYSEALHFSAGGSHLNTNHKNEITSWI